MQVQSTNQLPSSVFVQKRKSGKMCRKCNEIVFCIQSHFLSLFRDDDYIGAPSLFTPLQTFKHFTMFYWFLATRFVRAVLVDAPVPCGELISAPDFSSEHCVFESGKPPLATKVVDCQLCLIICCKDNLPGLVPQCY